MTFNKLNAAEAAIAVPGDFSIGIRQLIESGTGQIPADATLGKALKIQAGNDSIAEHLAKGGSVGVVIIALGGVCLLLGILKFFEVTSFKTPQPEDVQHVLTTSPTAIWPTQKPPLQPFPELAAHSSLSASNMPTRSAARLKKFCTKRFSPCARSSNASCPSSR